MKLLHFTLLFAFCNITEATTYYLDPNGTDSGNGNISAPWKTLPYALKTRGSLLSAGDILYLRGGVYSGASQQFDLEASDVCNGTSNSPITVSAYQGEIPIIADTTSHANIMRSKAWWVFNGITWSNCYSAVYGQSLTNCTWSNCSFGWVPGGTVVRGSPTAPAAWSLAWLFGESHYNKFQSCLFTNWGSIYTNADGSPHIFGCMISFGNDSTDDNTTYNLVEKSSFGRVGHDFINAIAGYNVIRSNSFHNEPFIPTNSIAHMMYNLGSALYEENEYGLWSSRFFKSGDITGTQHDQRNVWEYNSLIYSGPPADSAGAYGLEIVSDKNIWRYNTIAYMLAAGIYFNYDGAAWARSNTVYNNTIFNCGLSGTYGGDNLKKYSRGIDVHTFANEATNNYIVNNIIWGNYPSNVTSACWTNQFYRTNWNGDLANCTYPIFINTNGVGYSYNPANLPNLRLQSMSPCIDNGTWLAFTVGSSNASSTMKLDNSLYFSDGNQIVAGDTIKLQNSTNTAIVLQNDWTNNTLYLDRTLSWSDNQGISLNYTGTAPDMGAFESSGAITYYVSQSSGLDSNDGSLSNPWKTIKRAATNVTANSIVRVLAGTYDEQVRPSNSGTNGGNIVYVGTNAIVRGFDISSRSNISIIGFTFIQPDSTNYRYDAIFLERTHNCQIIDNIFTNTWGSAINLKASTNATGKAYSNGNVIRGNKCYRIGMTAGKVTGANIIFVNGTNNLVEYNYEEQGADYVCLFGSQNVVRNNSFGPTPPDITPDPHIDLVQSYNSYLVLPTIQNLFEANYGVSNMLANSHGVILQQSQYLSHDLIYRRNVVSWLGEYPVMVDGWQNFYGYNNTICDTLVTDNPKPFYSISVLTDETVTNLYSTNFVWIDTIHYNANRNVGGTLYAFRAPTMVRAEYNLAYLSGTPSPTGGGDVLSDPQFVSYAGGDFHLQSSSPARNASTNQTVTTAAGTSTNVISVLDSGYFCSGWGVVTGDKILVGANSAVTLTNIVGNNLYVNSSISFASNAPVWLDGTKDMGAFPYKAAWTITPTNTASGNNYTVTCEDTNLVRMVIFYEDSIPKTPVYNSPYTYTSSGGSVSAKVYPLYASQQVVYDAVNIIPPSPQTSGTLIKNAVIRNGKL